MKNIPIYVLSNLCFDSKWINIKRWFDLLLIEEKDQSHYVLIKEFNTFMYNQTLDRDWKYFCCYCFRSFTSSQIAERNVNDCLEVSDEQMIKRAKRGWTVKFKNYTRKIKTPFMIYNNFESILIPKNNGKQNSRESYINK